MNGPTSDGWSTCRDTVCDSKARQSLAVKQLPSNKNITLQLFVLIASISATFTLPLEYSLVTEDADFPEFVALMFQAIHPNGFVDACWPNKLDPEAQNLHASSFVVHKNMDPTVTWTKVTDTETSKIIGVAQWCVLKDQKPPDFDFDGPLGTWEKIEKAYAQDIHRSFVRHRREMIRREELPIVVLGIMTVHPRHEHRGAGTLMMHWGTEFADELNALSLVDVTLAGRWLYEKSGFAVKHHYAIEASGKLDRGVAQRLFFMVRPRKDGK